MTRRLMAQQGLSLTQASQAVGLAKSSWYYQPQPRQPRSLNPTLVAAIDTLWSQTRGVYGYRKIHAMLRANGFIVNHKAVLRHLRRLDRLQPRKLKGIRWTRPRVVHPTSSNTYWEMDLTYVWGGSGFGYLFALDAYDEGIPGRPSEIVVGRSKPYKPWRKPSPRDSAGAFPTGIR